MARIENYEDVIEALKPQLMDYLDSQDLNPRKHFSCIHPDHNDSGPSCSIMPDKKRAKCFGCGEMFDIFDACHFLEDRPQTGPNFVSENVMYLAEKFNVAVELKELTEEEKYKLETLNAYKHAANYIAAHSNLDSEEEMRRREWKADLCKNHLIGSVDTYKDYREFMKDKGYSVSFLESVDLLPMGLFAPTNLIFTVCDDYGRPCGFGARNLKHDPADKTSKKYINTSAKCTIYEKSKRLYNIHNAKKANGTLYITEGYADTQSMIQHGIEKVVCVGGTAFTDYHVVELARMNETDITLLLDGDDAGITSANKIISKFAGQTDFSIKIIVLPNGKDPDDFLREDGVDAFKELRRWSAFEWKLNSYDDRIEPLLIRKEIIPLIASESSAMERERMTGILSDKTGFSTESIKTEVEEVFNETERKMKTERDRIIKKTVMELENNPTEWRLTLSDSRNDLESVSEKYDENTFSPMVQVKELNHIRERQLDPVANGLSFDFAQWRQFNEAIAGNHQATMNVIGGVANAGKTAWMSNAALMLARNTEENNCVIFHTIDDTFEQFSDRLVTIMARERYNDIHLGKIKNPNGFTDAARIHEARNWAHSELIKLIQNKKLLIQGGEASRNAATLVYADEMIKYMKKHNPEGRIVYFGDNFHRYRDFQGADERSRFKKLSNEMKDIAKRYNIPVWVTMEYNKTVGTGRPTNNSISESIAMEYDANFIMHLYSDWHNAIQEGVEPDVYFQRQAANGHFEKQPRIEAIVGKNKINSFKGSLFFDFYADQSYMQEVSKSVVEQEKKAELARKSNER